MNRQRLGNTIFVHKTSGNLLSAWTAHKNILAEPESMKRRHGYIEASKDEFRRFVKYLVDDKFEITAELSPFRKPLNYDEFVESIHKAYAESDFDWKNWEEFSEFNNWYSTFSGI